MLNLQVNKEISCLSWQLIYMLLYLFLSPVLIVFMFEMKFIVLSIVVLQLLVTTTYIKYYSSKFNNLEQWKETDAKVINAKVIRCFCFSAFRVRPNEHEVYKPNILYRYEYNNEQIYSNQYALSYDDVDCNFNYSKSEAENIVNKIKKNKTMKIFVNQDTGESVVTLIKAKGYGISYMGTILINSLLIYFAYKIT